MVRVMSRMCVRVRSMCSTRTCDGYDELAIGWRHCIAAFLAAMENAKQVAAVKRKKPNMAGCVRRAHSSNYLMCLEFDRERSATSTPLKRSTMKRGRVLEEHMALRGNNVATQRSTSVDMVIPEGFVGALAEAMEDHAESRRRVAEEAERRVLAHAAVDEGIFVGDQRAAPH